MNRVLISLIAAPVIFVVAAVVTRATPRRIAAALAGAAAFAVGNWGWDVLAARMRWWAYMVERVPPTWYVAAGVAGAGVALVGWRVHRRYGLRGAAIFVLAFGVFCIVRDARLPETVIVFADGVVPRLADGAAGLTLMIVALAIILLLGGKE
jgi:hypothetical protein